MRIWVMASRPKTLFAATAPVIVGTAMAAEAGSAHLWTALAAALAALLIQIGTNFANDYVDFLKGADTQQRLGPTRVTQAGLVSPQAMRLATGLVFGLAALVGLTLVWRGGWPILVIGLLSILCGILYTAGPFPLAYIGAADLFVLLFFGPVAVGGTYYVQTLELTAPVLWMGLGPGLLSMAILTVNNLRDIEQDRQAGKRTLAVRLGPTFARLQYLLALVTAAALPLGLYLATGTHPAAMATLLLLAAAVPSIRAAFTARGRALNPVLGRTGLLLLLYSLLFSVGWLI